MKTMQPEIMQTGLLSLRLKTGHFLWLVLLLASLLLISACGRRGDLYFPEPPPPQTSGLLPADKHNLSARNMHGWHGHGWPVHKWSAYS